MTAARSFGLFAPLAAAIHPLDAYVVGGAIRDGLLGRPPKDWDLVVCGVHAAELSAQLSPSGPVEPVRVADQVLGVVWRPGWGPPDGFEVLLARTEVSTGPGYRDFSFTLDPSITIEDDLRRRDFTCNAIAQRLSTGGLIDPFDGRTDLERGLLRAVTPTTISQDPLRTLRGIARCAIDELTPASDTWQQLARWAPALAFLPGEQAIVQLRAAMRARHAAHGLRIASETGVLEQVIPGWAAMRGFDQSNPFHVLTVDEHSLAAVDAACAVDADEVVRWTMLLHDFGKPMMGWSRPGELMPDGRPRLRFHANPDAPLGEPAAHPHEWHSARYAAELFGGVDGGRPRLPVDAELRDEVPALCAAHMFSEDENFAAARPQRQMARARSFLVAHGTSRALRLLEVRHCDRAGKRPGAPAGQAERDSALFGATVRGELERGFPMAVGDLAISGGDLARLGAVGPAIGALQRTLLDRAQQANDPYTFNTAERLERAALALLALPDARTTGEAP